MKNRLLGVLLALLFFCHCSNRADVTDMIIKDNLIFTHEECLPDVEDKYVYPITPGTEEWKNIGSREDAIKVFQLPDNILKNISTLGLIRSFLDIPIWWNDYYLSSNTSRIITFNRIYPEYNCNQELFSREDAGEKLIKYFNDMHCDCLEIPEAIDPVKEDDQIREAEKQLNFMAQLAALQVFFTQQKILDQLNHEDRQKVVGMLLSKHEQIQKLTIEGVVDPAAIEVMAFIMYDSKYQPIVAYFGENKSVYENIYLSDLDIISFAKQFIR